MTEERQKRDATLKGWRYTRQGQGGRLKIKAASLSRMNAGASTEHH
jgi:hypothetical protein